MDEEVMMGDNGTLDSHDHDGSVLINNVIKEYENPNVDFLEDLDSYLDDINNRLTVSRFVSDLVTKGMLNAVETETAEKIGQKEIQLSRLKETLLLYHVGSQENETPRSLLILDKACEDEYEQSLLLEKTKEITGLCGELELISKLFTGHENGDIEALEDKERADQLHRKISGRNVSASLVWDKNDKHIGSVTLTSEKLEDLRQLSHEQLINHFKSEMNRLKREHDYTIQEMTEEYFSIKRRCLNLEQCGSFPSLKKNKDFDVLRKKIPDIILKLDKVLLEGEKSVFQGKNDAGVKSQFDSLLLENLQLKDSLSEAGEKISQLSQVEVNL